METKPKYKIYIFIKTSVAFLISYCLIWLISFRLFHPVIEITFSETFNNTGRISITLTTIFCFLICLLLLKQTVRDEITQRLPNRV